MSKRYEAVLFDVDGVLVDSYGLIEECHRRILQEFCGLHIDRFESDVPWGTTFVNQLAYLLKKHQCSSSTPVSTLVSHWRRLYHELHDHLVVVHKGVRELLTDFWTSHIAFGVVTNRDRNRFDLVSKLIPELQYASCVVTLDDVQHPKPDSEAILRALKELNVRHSRALYVGDTKNDLLAAGGASVDCLIVLERVTPNDIVVSGANVVRTVARGDGVASAVASLVLNS